MEQDAIVQLLGRLHPLLLHMPIGLWFGVVALEFGGALVRREPNRATLAILAWMAALGGAFAAGSGWILGSKGYNNDTIDLHRWLGVTAAAIGIVTASLGALRNRGAFRLLLVAEFLSLMAAGHYGSEQTHGKDWLTEPFQQKASTPSATPAEPAANAPKPEVAQPIVPAATQETEPPKSEADAKHDPKPLFPPIEPRKPIAQQTGPGIEPGKTVVEQTGPGAPIAPLGSIAQTPDPAVTTTARPPSSSEPTDTRKLLSFRAQVEPILQTYCVSCHGETRKKGGLRLHTPAAIREGGENGAVVKAGDVENSPLHALLLLPHDDERHMPPSNKKQPTADEIALLRRWIEQGAKFDAAEQQSPAPAQPAAEGESKKSDAQAKVAPATPWNDEADAAMQSLHAQQVHVSRVAEGSDDLWVDFGAVATTSTDEQACAQAQALAPWIADLSVARSGAAAATLAACATMPRLRRLDLRSTKATSEHVKLLGAHASLQELVLADTAVDDACVDALLAMPQLRRVYVWNTKLSDLGIARLCLRHGLSVDVGETARPPVAEASADKPAAMQKPRNTTCPVSGSPVDPKYAVWFEGRAIGFCCPNCPKTFWAEPAKYPVADR
jgi:uncharacterized membrane protein